MLDLVISGGTVVDGTGAPRKRADVGVRGDRIVAVGTIDEPAVRTIDAEGMIVAPGFVDLHTHYDAQVFWDPALTPSCLHGATTVIMGNCGFTLAPMAPEHQDYITRMLACVEGMPLESLQASVPYDWGTFGEYLDRIDGHVALNVGVLVGHSTLRRYVMGERAVGDDASPEELAEMRRVLAASVAAGGLGFSSSNGPHHDGDGNPVPSRAATPDEIVALAGVIGDYPGTTLEFIPGVGGTTPESLELMTQMSAAANRPVNWNVLSVDPNNSARAWEMIEGSDYAAARGAKVVALAVCAMGRAYQSFKTGFLFGLMPGWAKVMALDPPEKLEALRDPEVRARLRSTGHQWRFDWNGVEVLSTFAPENAQYEGRTLGDIAHELGSHPIDVAFDITIADELETMFRLPAVLGGDDDETWKLRSEIWQDPRVIVGASDAGAHLDMLTMFTFGTSVLGSARDHSMMSLEEAVNLITERPARLYGLRDRGRIEEGWHADVVVFDEHAIAPGTPYFRNDLPAGAGRLFADPSGVHHVVVNGREVVCENELTGDLPGTVLRSGRDTETVTAH